MKQFIKSSTRTKPDPAYYKRIIDRLQPKRDALLNQAEAAGDVYESDPESEFRREANKLSAKISWAITQLGVAIRMRDNAKSKGDES